jgi:cyclopropane fatty-acyl-phospholipid synthase-like methyltransferase
MAGGADGALREAAVRRAQAILLIVVLLMVPVGIASAQDRRPFLDLFLTLADVRSGMTVADVGAGNGDFAFRLADAVWPGGRVYANEISADNLAQIERRRQERSLNHVTVVPGGESDPKLPGPVDRITMIDVYHHLAKPVEFLAMLRKALKPGGRLIVAAVVNQRNPEAKPSTSKTHDACVSDPEETRKAIEQAGFVFETLVLHDDPVRSSFWPTSYALVFRTAETATSRRPAFQADQR